MPYKVATAYYDRYDPNKVYKKVRFEPGKSLVTPELNESMPYPPDDGLKPQVRDYKDTLSVWDVIRKKFTSKE